jgi:hypothetical protein
MADAAVEQLFPGFSQIVPTFATRSQSSGDGIAGLGLAICQQLLENSPNNPRIQEAFKTTGSSP